MPKRLNTIAFTFSIDGKPYGKSFTVEKEAIKEDAQAIADVMREWLQRSLEEIL